MRGRWIGATLLVVGLLAVAGTVAGEGDELSIAIDAEGQAQTDDPGGWVASESHDPPEAYAWRLNLPGDYQIANVTVDADFPVDRGRQVVPLLDDGHFVKTPDPSDVDRAAPVFNLSTHEDGWNYELGLPGPGQANLTLERDVEPPGVEVVDVGNLTDIGFDVTTNTTETARGELFVDSEEGQRLQNYPVSPGAWQHFPVQGLDANTTYLVHARLADWSGNEATTDTFEVTTEPSENPPEPLVEPVRPEPNATVSPGTVVVEASYSEEGWPVVEQDVAMFFDKERVDRSRLEVGDGRITFRPDGLLEERPYHVSVEVPNTAGGTGIARWSFQVEDEPRQAPAPLGLGAAAIAALLASAARRRG